MNFASPQDPAGAGPLVRITLATDERYAMPTAVAMRSAENGLPPEVDIEAAVLTRSVTQQTKRRIEASLSRTRILWIELDPQDLHGLPGSPMRTADYTSTVWATVMLGRSLPSSWSKVIYLDSDLVVLGNLADLWREPTQGHVLAAVRDAPVPKVSSPFGISRWRELHLDGDAPYFNSGVMLIDLDLWRAEGIDERSRAFAVQNASWISQVDQEVLNVVAYRRWVPLDIRWNVVSWWRHAGRLVGPHEDLFSTARIYHFAGSSKPWLEQFMERPFAERFYENLDRTAWSGWRPHAKPGSEGGER